MIGKDIKSLRKSHDLTQPEFARIVGISRNSLSRYENGTSSVSTELIDIINRTGIVFKWNLLKIYPFCFWCRIENLLRYQARILHSRKLNEL